MIDSKKQAQILATIKKLAPKYFKGKVVDVRFRERNGNLLFYITDDLKKDDFYTQGYNLLRLLKLDCEIEYVRSAGMFKFLSESANMDMREKLLDFFKKKYIGYEGKTFKIIDFCILTKEQHDTLPKGDKFMLRNRDWVYVVFYEHTGEEKDYGAIAKFLSSLEARFSVEDGFRMTDNIAVLNYTEKIQESRSLIQQVLREHVTGTGALR